MKVSDIIDSIWLTINDDIDVKDFVSLLNDVFKWKKWFDKVRYDKWLGIWKTASEGSNTKLPSIRVCNEAVRTAFTKRSKQYTDEQYQYAVGVYVSMVNSSWYKSKPLNFAEFLIRKEWWLEKYINKDIYTEDVVDNPFSSML